MKPCDRCGSCVDDGEPPLLLPVNNFTHRVRLCRACLWMWAQSRVANDASENEARAMLRWALVSPQVTK